jgi:DNA-binding IscR family transcriptional regulator
MMISTRGRYALRILVDLAENRKDGYITLRRLPSARKSPKSTSRAL